MFYVKQVNHLKSSLEWSAYNSILSGTPPDSNESTFHIYSYLKPTPKPTHSVQLLPELSHNPGKNIHTPVNTEHTPPSALEAARKSSSKNFRGNIKRSKS